MIHADLRSNRFLSICQVLGSLRINSPKGGGGKREGLATGFFWVSKNVGDAGHRFLA
jgi:hypothetical protein